MAPAENQAHPDSLAQSQDGADFNDVRRMQDGSGPSRRASRYDAAEQINRPDSLALESKIAVHSKNRNTRHQRRTMIQPVAVRPIR
jgi:hypothetical protein